MLNMDVIPMLASGAGKPLITSPAIEGLKHFVNHWSQPQFSLPLFVVLFVMMLVFYRKWTRPVVAAGLLAVFCAFYFGSMLIDHNYLLIVTKPDNVPITLLLLSLGLCLWVAFRQASINDQCLREGKPLPFGDREDKVLVWPDLVYIELIALVLAAAVLVIWSVGLPAPLESPANPAGPPNPSKAPWYVLGLQEMLVYFDPWMAGVILPGMIVTGLISMPYIDTNPKGNGYYTLRDRPFAIGVWLFGFIVLWVILIVFGTFLRGPNWNFFGPYEYWDATRLVPLTNINLSDYVWTWMLNQPLPDVPFVREAAGIAFVGAWLLVLPVILARTIMRRMYMQMGSLRFYIMAIHLVVMGLMTLKMPLRWLFNMKYFIYLPEFNLNL
ncbi:MAG: hypothetical protein IT440_14540 [Phycisphaeraceae bacterium]|nr:hypothetical protein [Phycisphaeraceae bacterium]